MAGMFYSLQEAAEKLNKTEEEIKQFVQEGKLREFRDGPNLLFKVEEVEALMSPATEEALEAVELEPAALEPEALEPEIPEIEGLEEIPEAEALEPEVPELEGFDLDIPAGENPELEALEAEMLAPAEEAAGTSEILLAPETGAPLAPNESELTNADTALTGEGISVLGETDGDFEITDDTLAETAIPMSTTGTGPEMPLEEIEGDVNLDSFGSGSGLLDLSLQADDTSLGGILDEIYTDEVEGAEPAFEEVGADSAAAVGGEAGEMPDDGQPMISEPALDVPMAVAARSFVEAAPDMSSNTLGMLLFLPLLIVIYTAVVAVSGQKEVMPSILSGVQAFIWFIMGGAAVVALLVAGVAFMSGGGGATKVKKAKKPKAPKAKKEKKPKKEKKAKAPKPKKEKKKKK
jgi:hypothetical protein